MRNDDNKVKYVISCRTFQRFNAMLCSVKLQEGLMHDAFSRLYSFQEQLIGPLFYGKILWETLLYCHFHHMLNISVGAQCSPGYRAFFDLHIHIPDTANSSSIVGNQ